MFDFTFFLLSIHLLIWHHGSLQHRDIVLYLFWVVQHIKYNLLYYLSQEDHIFSKDIDLYGHSVLIKGGIYKISIFSACMEDTEDLVWSMTYVFPEKIQEVSSIITLRGVIISGASICCPLLAGQHVYQIGKPFLFVMKPYMT